MRKTVPIALLLLFGATMAAAQKSDPVFVSGEILIKSRLQAAATDAALKGVYADSGLLESFSDTGWLRIRLPAGIGVSDAVRKFGNEKWVDSAQPNYIYRLEATPDDTRFGEMYGLAKISAPAAWDTNTGSPETVVAVIDTGIRYTHEDLAGNIWTNPGEIPSNGIDDDGNGFVDDYHGYDFFFNDPDPDDEHGHGTHVAGTIGAVGNNGLGVVGVNWNVRLMAIKIYDQTGFGTTSAMLINAYNYVRLMKQKGVNIKVTNNSYGGCDEACGYDQATRDALEALGDAGVLNVFAAGNDNRDVDALPKYPGSYSLPSILNVAASTADDSRASFSNFGPSNVDIAAPGSLILSTTIFGDGYGSLSGTSMASPHVAGAAALLASHDPSLSNASLKATLLNSAEKLMNWNGVVKTGGRLDLASAVSSPTVCSLTLSAKNVGVRTKGGIHTVEVTAPENCDASVRSDSGWIYLMSGGEISGSGTVRFRVPVNPTLTRVGSLTIGGEVVQVTQTRP